MKNKIILKGDCRRGMSYLTNKVIDYYHKQNYTILNINDNKEEGSILKIPRKDLKRIKEKQFIKQQKKKRKRYCSNGRKRRRYGSYGIFEEDEK